MPSWGLSSAASVYSLPDGLPSYFPDRGALFLLTARSPPCACATEFSRRGRSDLSRATNQITDGLDGDMSGAGDQEDIFESRVPAKFVDDLEVAFGDPGGLRVRDVDVIGAGRFYSPELSAQTLSRCQRQAKTRRTQVIAKNATINSLRPHHDHPRVYHHPS